MERTKTANTLQENVALAETLAAENGGILPPRAELKRKGYSALVGAMGKKPSAYAHIKQQRLWTGQKHGLSGTVEYRTVAGHHSEIRKGSPSYRDMPFYDRWNQSVGGSFAEGARWIIENLGSRPGNGRYELHIIDRSVGFWPGNLIWVPKDRHKQEEMLMRLLLENKQLKLAAQRNSSDSLHSS